MHVYLQFVKIKKKLARRNAKEINVRKVNGARPIARKLVTTVQNGNQSYF